MSHSCQAFELRNNILAYPNLKKGRERRLFGEKKVLLQTEMGIYHFNNMQQDEAEYIDVYGARVHNLKNIDAHIPRGSLTVIIVLGFRHAFCRRPAALH